jgi:hypothetical protein
VGTVEDVVEFCKPHIDAGYRHLIFDSPAPYDEESVVRLATEVRPQLEALLATTRERHDAGGARRPA